MFFSSLLISRISAGTSNGYTCGVLVGHRGNIRWSASSAHQLLPPQSLPGLASVPIARGFVSPFFCSLFSPHPHSPLERSRFFETPRRETRTKTSRKGHHHHLCLALSVCCMHAANSARAVAAARPDALMYPAAPFLRSGESRRIFRFFRRFFLNLKNNAADKSRSAQRKAKNGQTFRSCCGSVVP